MDIQKINNYMAESKWTALLGELPAGTHTLSFPNIEAIKSCKAVAYSLNSDYKAIGRGYEYKFNVDKTNRLVTVVVSEIGK